MLFAISKMSSWSPPRYLIHFQLPNTKPLIFDKIFRYNDRGTQALLQALAQKRADMVSWLSRPTAAEAGIAIVREYLPHLHGLVLAIQTTPELRTYTTLSTLIFCKVTVF